MSLSTFQWKRRREELSNPNIHVKSEVPVGSFENPEEGILLKETGKASWTTGLGRTIELNFEK